MIMFLTLNEYLNGAKKILSIYGYKHHIKDDDAISFVAYYMMKADNTWDGKSSSRNTWRFNQARYAILKLKNKHRKQKEKKEISLYTPIGKDSNSMLCDTIADNRTHNEYDFNEVIKTAERKLSSTQFKCLKMYFCENMNMEEVGNKLGITKQAVSLNIQQAKKALRREYSH
jgi:RNA polymerase sigma factor (sigma-70 family)